jgi:6-pyruvoyltetrahydropterin/6-carboxytetrahydropterin synthase
VYEVRVETEFSAAHRLRGYDGKCERLHGHNYRVGLALCCSELDSLGMAVDFSEVRRIARDVVGRFDHRCLNDVEPFDTVNPTAEQIARHVAEAVGGRLPAGVRVQGVTCWESDRCSATYLPDASSGVKARGKRQ